MGQTKILITGGAGFIGGSLAERLTDNEDNFVVIVDNLLTGKQEKLPDASKSNWKFINCDVNEFRPIASIMQSYQFDYVFHYAAVVGVKRTLDNPVLVLSDIQGIKNILELGKNTGVKRIIYASSSEVYGESISFPQNEETTPLNSRLPYAVVKNVGEAYCKSYQKTYNLDYTIYRFFNTYGSKQSTDFVVSKFLKAAINNKPLTIFGDGKQTRTFCYIDDHLDATTAVFDSNQYKNDVINIGNDIEITIEHLAKTIIKLCKSKSPIEYLPALNEGDMPRRMPDATKMKNLLNRNLVTLEEGLQKIIESNYYKQKYNLQYG